MDPEYFGTEQVTEEDRAYRGSRFSEVRDALFANPYQKVWGGRGEPPLPSLRCEVAGVLRGVLPFGSAVFFSAGGRESRRFASRFALGRRPQGFPAHHSSERHLPDRPVGNHRTDPLFRLFPSRTAGRW